MTFARSPSDVPLASGGDVERGTAPTVTCRYYLNESDIDSESNSVRFTVIVKPLMTHNQLVDMAYQQLATLPAPPNGQVRQLPSDRAVRYYTSIGLIDRPKMRGRTAIYDRRHLAQLVAIKRLQQVGKSLADIQALWSSIDDDMLGRISGIPLDGSPLGTPRALRDLLFWKHIPVPIVEGELPKPPASSLPAPAELRVDLAPGITLVLTGAARQRLLSALETTRNEEP